MRVPEGYAPKPDSLDLEGLKTEELELLLQKDFNPCENHIPDIPFHMAIVKILQERSQEHHDQILLGTEDAWKDFLENYKDQPSLIDCQVVPEEYPSTDSRPLLSRLKKRKLKKLRASGLIAAVALICIVFIAGTNEFNFPKIWGKLQEESYHIISSKDSTRFKDNELAEQLEHFRTEVAEYTLLPVLPYWFPAGTSIQNVKATSRINSTEITGNLLVNDDEFFITIIVYESELEESAPAEEPSKEFLAEEYNIAGIQHDITRNNSVLKAVWQNANLVCSIQGTLSMKEMKHMLDSIYE